jgi:hypothetical protein
MKSPRPAYWVYLLGVGALGLVVGMYEKELRSTLGDWLPFGVVILYLLLLRLLGEYVERRLRPSDEPNAS